MTGARLEGKNVVATDLIAAGRVMVMPTPTAEPCIAAIVGLRHRWIARATRPPLERASAMDYSLCFRPREKKDRPIPMIRRPHSFPSSTEADLEIRSCAEGVSGAGQNDRLDALVQVKHAEHLLQVLGHDLRKSIVFLGPVQRDDHDRGCGRGACWVVGDFDVRGGKGLI